MSKMRTIGLASATAALLITSATPAYAGWNTGLGWGGGPVFGNVGWSGGNSWGRRGRGGRGGDDTGEILGGVLLGAILMGAISSSKKKRDQQRTQSEDYPERDNSYRRAKGNISSEDQAVDACAVAAEDRAGRSTSVRDVDQVRRNGDGWDVEGVVETRDGWRDRTGDRRRFTCSVKYGSVDSVYVEDAKVAFAD